MIPFKLISSKLKVWQEVHVMCQQLIGHMGHVKETTVI